jgi:hypothetical protein
LHRAIRVNKDETTEKRLSILQTKQFSTPKIQSLSALKICRVLINCQIWKVGRYLISHVSSERRIIQSMFLGVWEVESTAFGLATELAGGMRAEKSVPGFPAGCSPLFIPSVKGFNNLVQCHSREIEKRESIRCSLLCMRKITVVEDNFIPKKSTKSSSSTTN